MIHELSRAAAKMRGRSLTELRVRGAQALAAWRERTGRAHAELSVDDAALAGRLRSGVPSAPDALLAGFRARPATFFPAFDDPAATVAALVARCPADRDDVLAGAGRALAGRFDVLGYDGLSYGAPVDWHRDPVRGLRAPPAHWSRVPYLDATTVGDHKVTWEVNRQQYLVRFGQAYWYTGDERWARAFVDHVSAWMDANPPKQGINWASSLEVAFRAMSWVWALHFFRGAASLTPALYARMLNYLHVHARHLEQYLSTYFSPNTHLTGEALGLVFVGACVPELAAAERWRRTGVDVLRTWLPRQVRDDGGYFEQATQYHRYTTEFTLQLLLLDERHGWGLAPTLRPVLERLMTLLQWIARPDGTMPLIGDDDGGKLVFLDDRPPDDVRSVLAQGAAWLRSPELAHSAGDPAAAYPAALWLLGAPAAAALDALPPRVPTQLSRAFEATGLYVMRDGWGADAAHAVIDCGPHGVLNFGHAHADALSLTASADGRHLVVDSGTFSYPGAARNEFRGAGAHNTVLVDGVGSSEPADGAFQWRSSAHGRELAWAAHATFAYFEGTHDGFARLQPPVAHRRAVLFLPDFGWVVRDTVVGSGERSVRVQWHLAADLRAELNAERHEALAVDGAGTAALRAVAFGSPLLRGPRAEGAWISPRYGARVAAARLVYEQEGAGEQTVVSCLLRPGEGPSPPEVGEVPAAVRGAGRALLLQQTGSRATRPRMALVMLGGPGETVVDVRSALGGSSALASVPSTVAVRERGCAWLVDGGDGTATLGLGPGCELRDGENRAPDLMRDAADVGAGWRILRLTA